MGGVCGWVHRSPRRSDEYISLRLGRQPQHVTLDASLGWNEEAFKGFLRELAGAVAGLSNLLSVYRAYRPRYTELSGRLAATDALIDQVVYRLYGLSEEEVAIVEGES